MKKKLLVYSDCYIYGGSERLMSFLLGNEILNSEYSLSFAYRTHSIYRNGMEKDFSKLNVKLLPLKLLSNDTFFYNVKNNLQSRFLVSMIKIPFLLFYYTGFYSIYNSIVLSKLLIRHRPDIIHINNGGFPAARTCNLLAFVAYFFKIDCVVYQVNNQAQKARFVDFARNRFLNKVVDKFITSSMMARNTLSKNVGIDLEKIGLVRNIVSVQKSLLNKNLVLDEFSLEKDTFLLVQVAFLTERKGQIYLLKALRQLLNDRKIDKKVCLLLIGDGEDKDKLQRFCIDNDLDRNVKFLGYKMNYTEYMNAADMVILPSIMNEDLPLVIIEALMLGKCILSTSLAGIAEVVENEESGILISPSIETIQAELYEKVKRFILHPQEMEKISTNAFERSKIFSSVVYGNTLKKIYNGE